MFTAPIDHETNVTSYWFDVFTSTADPSTATPVATANLGKPDPDPNSDIASDQSALFSSLAAGNYIATVTAVEAGWQHAERDRRVHEVGPEGPSAEGGSQEEDVPDYQHRAEVVPVHPRDVDDRDLLGKRLRIRLRWSSCRTLRRRGDGPSPRRACWRSTWPCGSRPRWLTFAEVKRAAEAFCRPRRTRRN